MSTTDKTGEKLVDSMRRTKAAAAGKEPATKPKTATRKTRSGASKSRGQKSQTATRKQGNDPYQSGRRVWPD